MCTSRTSLDAPHVLSPPAFASLARRAHENHIRTNFKDALERTNLVKSYASEDLHGKSELSDKERIERAHELVERARNGRVADVVKTLDLALAVLRM